MAAISLAEYRETQRNIVLLAERELDSFIASLNFNGDLKAVVRALELFMPELIRKYGEIGASVAADFYDELRADARTRQAYKAVMGDAIPIDKARVSTKWAVGPLFRDDGVPDISAAFSNLTDITDRLIKQQGRDTIHWNSSRDPAQVRYARVPTGRDTCSYCLMLASRGAVYVSESSASNLNKYHGRCDCVPHPVWDDSDYDRLRAENGYDPDKLYSRWQDALESEQDKA